MPQDGVLRLKPDAIEGFDGTGTTLGFYGVAAVARPSAYTQTFATADKTMAARAAAALTDNTGGTADTTIAAIPDPADAPASADALRDDLVANALPALRNAIADIAAQVNNLRTDERDTASVVNSLVDDLQALGLVQ